jgi:hypothetical protein
MAGNYRNNFLTNFFDRLATENIFGKVDSHSVGQEFSSILMLYCFLCFGLLDCPSYPRLEFFEIEIQNMKHCWRKIPVHKWRTVSIISCSLTPLLEFFVSRLSELIY